MSGCKSEQECYTAVRRYAYILKKFVQPEIGFVENYEIQNMSASCTLPFAVSLATMATRCDPSKRFSRSVFFMEILIYLGVFNKGRLLFIVTNQRFSLD